MHNSTYPQRLSALISALWFMLIWLTMMFMASRYAMMRDFMDPEILSEYSYDIKRMWVMGLRYDARVGAIMLLPAFGLGIFLCIGSGLWTSVRRLSLTLFAIVSFIAVFFAVGNYYYYQTYTNYIDIFAFGFLNEDQTAVLGNIWQDYPVLKGTIAFFLLTFIPLIPAGWIIKKPERIAKKFWRQQPKGPLRIRRFMLYFVISATLFGVLARGSIGTFPLGRNDSNISSATIINKLTPNGLITFHWARSDYLNDITFEEAYQEEGIALIKQSGFSLMEKTPRNEWLKNNRPHAVVVLMESFGSNLLAFDHLPENDLLGAFRPHLAEDFFFRRFLPEGNGTALSLAALFFHSPAQNISHSSAQNIPLGHTPFKVYKEAGYSTIFIYPGNMMWRNMANYMLLQGVDKLYDQNDLIRLYPESKKALSAWGVPDEYAYKLAQKLLAEANDAESKNEGQPLFIGILTTSNHPPYRVPAHYKPHPVALTPQLASHSEDGGITQLDIEIAFQYAANAMGEFLSELKASPAGQKTLVAATGDHQMRRLKAFEPVESAFNLAVPLYVYVPEAIKQHVKLRYDPERPGSHKDVMPTMYAHSLSDTEYMALGGRNILAPVDDESRAFGYNGRMWIDREGAYIYGTEKFLRPWAYDEVKYDRTMDKSWLMLSKKTIPLYNKMLQDKIRAYPELLHWQINARVSGKNLF